MTVTENQIIQMQEETNRIIESIESQKMDSNTANLFIYVLLITVAISMIFEYFVREYRKKKKEKKQNGESTNEIVTKLFITYSIHIITLVILWLICLYLMKFTILYVCCLIAISIYIVGISPLFTFYFKSKKNEKDK